MNQLKCKPLREITANSISTTVFFYSKKKDRQVMCESNLEWDAAIVIEHDPHVVDYCEQAIELVWSGSNWIPDFVVLLENEEESYDILIIEVKYLQELLEDRDYFKTKYSETEEYVRNNQIKLAKQITNLPIRKIDFIIITDHTINQSFRVQNLRELMEASSDPVKKVEISRHIKSILSKTSEMEIERLVKSINLRNLPDGTGEDDLWTAIYEMIYYMEITIDFEQHLTAKTKLKLPNGSISFESISTWLRKYNWENQHNENSTISHQDLYGFHTDPKKSVKLWEEANARYEIIKDLLSIGIEELKQKQIVVDGRNYHWSTIYQWILAYKRSHGELSSLIPKYEKRGRKNLQDKITNELFEIGKEAYLKSQRKGLSKETPIAKKTITQSYEVMKASAKRNNQIRYCMSYSTFYRKINDISPKKLTECREGTKVAEHKNEICEAEFPHGDYALQTIQIDHTPIDVLVVDNEERKVTERPYITVAFDAHTRCVLGYYITFDEPSRLSIGMTLLNCVSNKRETIAKVRKEFPDLNQQELKSLETSEWANVFGLPYTLHMDNGADFRSDDIILFGLSYKLHLQYRPVGKPQFGAYIERFLGTLNKRLHSISGTTNSNVQDRGDYPSEKRAKYTIDELEARIITEIVYYHHDIHSELYMTPLAKWRESFTAVGTRAMNRNLSLVNLEHFRFDILPSEMRTVQKKGIEIFNLHYASQLIERFIGVKKPNDKAKNKKFRIRYDPRDITKIWFVDNSDKNNCQYIPLICIDKFVQEYSIKNKQILSLWEWKAIKEDFEIKGKQYYDEDVLLDLVNLQQDMDKSTSEKTKTARKLEARKKRRTEDSLEISSNPTTLIENRPKMTEKSKTLNTIQNTQEINNFSISKTTQVKKITIPPKNSSRFANLDHKTAKKLAENENKQRQ